MYYCPCLYSVVHGYLRLVSDNYLVFHAYISWNSHVGEYLLLKIYIILFRLYKNVPMRPSLSSIKLGIQLRDS